MPEAERAKLRMTAISYVNELYGDEAAKRRARVKARFVNNAMMATVLGAVISDGLEDGRVVSGVGGQYNFVAQGFALEDARSVIMLRCDPTRPRGKTNSNIRWNYGHTTIPRHLRDIVVTEYGVADLRGKSDRDVIAAMLAVTDSRFQDELLRRAKDAGKIERNFELPAACRDNTPERIARALKPRGRAGADSAVSLRHRFHRGRAAADAGAGAAEGGVAAATGGHRAARLVRRVAKSPDVADCLARMGLDRPRSFGERVYAALVRGALARFAS